MISFYIEVIATPAYMGNPNDPLKWYRKVWARSEAEALASVPPGMKARIISYLQ
jgi:hypothetical protein